MYKLLAGLKSYLKWQPIETDNAIFRLHNSFTTVLLLTCSMIITATQFVGHPISCIVSGIPTHVVNTFCWIHSTFTMPDAFKRQVSENHLQLHTSIFIYLSRLYVSAYICLYLVYRDDIELPSPKGGFSYLSSYKFHKALFIISM